MSEQSTRLTVQEAADILGICPAAIRVRMRKGLLPIGRVVKIGKRREYMIYRGLVYREIGKEEENAKGTPV